MRRLNAGLNVRVDRILRSDFGRAAKANGSDSAKTLRMLMESFIATTEVNVGCMCRAPIITHCPVHGP